MFNLSDRFIRTSFHILAGTAILCTGLRMTSILAEHEEESELLKLKYICTTLANSGSPTELSNLDTDKWSQVLNDIVVTNGLEGYDLSIVSYNSAECAFSRKVSSDRMYSPGEAIQDPNGLLFKSLKEVRAERVEFPGGIVKAIGLSPVSWFGDQKGLIRLSSKGQSAIYTSSVTHFAPWALSGLYFILMFGFVLPKFRISEGGNLEQHKVQFDSELRKKDDELKMLSLVTKKSENLMIITDPNGSILWVNDTYENRNQFSAEELNAFVGRYLPDVSKNQHIRTTIRNVVEFKKSVVYESYSESVNSERCYSVTTVTPVCDSKGQVSNLLFVDTDITKLKRTEKENHAFKQFVVHSSSPRVHVSADGEILFSNDSALPLIQEWKQGGNEVNERIKAVLKSILISNEPQALIQSIQEENYSVRFIPNKEERTLHILAERLTTQTESEQTQVQGDKDLAG